MPQAERLEKARKWLASYDGDNVLKAYRKKFATDRMQALAELQLLGLTFTDEQIAAEKRAVQAYAQQQRAKKLKRRAKRRAAKRQAEFQNPDQNDYLLFYCRLYLRRCALWCDLGANGAFPMGATGRSQLNIVLQEPK